MQTLTQGPSPSKTKLIMYNCAQTWCAGQVEPRKGQTIPKTVCTNRQFQIKVNG
jgi:hypothetical protein